MPVGSVDGERASRCLQHALVCNPPSEWWRRVLLPSKPALNHGTTATPGTAGAAAASAGAQPSSTTLSGRGGFAAVANSSGGEGGGGSMKDDGGGKMGGKEAGEGDSGKPESAAGGSLGGGANTDESAQGEGVGQPAGGVEGGVSSGSMGATVVGLCSTLSGVSLPVQSSAMAHAPLHFTPSQAADAVLRRIKYLMSLLPRQGDGSPAEPGTGAGSGGKQAGEGGARGERGGEGAREAGAQDDSGGSKAGAEAATGAGEPLLALEHGRGSLCLSCSE